MKKSKYQSFQRSSALLLSIIIIVSGLNLGLFINDSLAQGSTISNQAQATFEDASGTNYGPVSSNQVDVTVVAPSDTTTPAEISNLASPSVAENSVTITWSATGDDGTIGTASSYDIRYSTTVLNDSNWFGATQAVGEPSPQGAGGKESFTVTSLSSGTKYWIAIKTSDEVPNVSPISNVLTSTTTVSASLFVDSITIKFPSRFYDEIVKVRIIDELSGTVKAEAKSIVDASNEIEIRPVKLDPGSYVAHIVSPNYLSKKIRRTLNVGDNVVDIVKSDLIIGNLSDSDDTINSLDWQIMSSTWGTNDQKADLNGDGIVNSLDWGLMNKYWGHRGDCDLDSIITCRTRTRT